MFLPLRFWRPIERKIKAEKIVDRKIKGEQSVTAGNRLGGY